MVRIRVLSQSRPTFERESAVLARGVAPVAGCDEVGRGPLAGPVVAAAVILDPANIPDGIDDSKKLDAARREQLYAALVACAEVGVALAPPARIDRDDIRKASLWALAAAVRALPRQPGHVLVDGRDLPIFACEGTAIVKGDALCLSIAAASIVAKVVRDRMMQGLDRLHPGYGFAAHKGYGTAAHRSALAALGPCCHHRRSFAPIRLADAVAAPDEPTLLRVEAG
ncbi:ribonuclease HII [Blastochloris viridis]|uniref:Ribonuclease HII n=1 Tax=Blastochloris viridis TaxID=1079 RepID=A0A0H5BPF4_BLAVI|nr:ribonuclease HII [Blastochloris viridis]ALK10832.1 Ribonuclease HII [Blastochloris viridis]BAR99193.1 ribonuclease HII [Blastochloris viridis]CUU43494.1 Ribonuclease HII [Blastochloris viridis]